MSRTKKARTWKRWGVVWQGKLIAVKQRRKDAVRIIVAHDAKAVPVLVTEAPRRGRKVKRGD